MNKKLFIITVAFIAGNSNVYSADESNQLSNRLGWEKLKNTRLDTTWQPLHVASAPGAASFVGVAGLSGVFGNEITTSVGLGLLTGCCAIYYARQQSHQKIIEEDTRLNGPEGSSRFGLVDEYNAFLSRASNKDSVIFYDNSIDRYENILWGIGDLVVCDKQKLERHNKKREKRDCSSLPSRYEVFRYTSYKQPQEIDMARLKVLGEHNIKIVEGVEAAMNKVRKAVSELPEEKKEKEVEGNDISERFYQIWPDSSTGKFTEVNPESLG